MAAIPRVILIDESLGIATGHVETRALVEHYLEQLEGRLPPSGGSAKTGKAKESRKPS
jgi:hypothetical protein